MDYEQTVADMIEQLTDWLTEKYLQGEIDDETYDREREALNVWEQDLLANQVVLH